MSPKRPAEFDQVLAEAIEADIDYWIEQKCVDLEVTRDDQ